MSQMASCFVYNQLDPNLRCCQGRSRVVAVEGSSFETQRLTAKFPKDEKRAVRTEERVDFVESLSANVLDLLDLAGWK
jgi:hypothetical protein